jgi:hypothetical protein
LSSGLHNNKALEKPQGLSAGICFSGHAGAGGALPNCAYVYKNHKTDFFWGTNSDSTMVHFLNIENRDHSWISVCKANWPESSCLIIVHKTSSAGAQQTHRIFYNFQRICFKEYGIEAQR